MSVGDGEASTSPLWTFSLQLYRAPKVADACIALQDHCGVDVNILLFVLYLAKIGRRLAPSDVALIDSAVAAWRTDVVVPLRAVRRSLRSSPATIDQAGAARLREAIKAQELEAEGLQQSALYALLAGETTLGVADKDAFASNLAAYATHLQQGFPQAATTALLEALATVRAGHA